MKPAFSVVTALSSVVLIAAACTAQETGSSTPAADPPTSGSPTASASSPSSPGAPSSSAASEPRLKLTGPPRVPYADGEVLIYPDGRTMRLTFPRGRQGLRFSPPSIRSIVAGEPGEFLATELGHHEVDVMLRVDAAGTVLDSWLTSGPAARSDDGRVAWVETPNGPYRRGPSFLHLGGRAQRVDQITGPASGGARWKGRRLLMPALDDEGKSRWWRVDRLDQLTRVGAPCRPRLVSPDGEHRVRTDYNRKQITVRDRSGDVVTKIRDERFFVRDYTEPQLIWEDDTHLLADWSEEGRHAVVRIDLAGGITRATKWRPRVGGVGPAVFVLE